MLKDATVFGTKVEVKNMNSIRNVQRAIEFEINRQITLLESNQTIVQETRAFDALKGTTISLRAKEAANDYRYFPEPDLPPLHITQEKIAEINPYVNVVLHETRLDNSNVMEIFSQYDIIVDGTDNFATRYLVNDACVLLKKPYVWGSIYRFDGQASVFWAEHGPCYRCLYPEPPPPGMVPSCAEGGVLGVLCASIGSIQVTEAIKLITGIGESLIGELMIYDALEMSYRKVKIRKDPNCVLCGPNATQKELLEDYEGFCGALSTAATDAVAGSTISVEQLKSKMDHQDNFLLIDVREPAEFEIVRIPGSVLIPKQEFLDGSVLSKLPQDKPIILHCKSGVRSAECLAVLKGAGFSDATHVSGGVIAWAKQIDTALPTY